MLDAAGSERAVVMGFSEGGPACALLAASAPERVVSLILYGAFAGAPTADADSRLRARSGTPPASGCAGSSRTGAAGA